MMLFGIFPGKFQHFRGEIHSVQLKLLSERQKIRTMGTAKIKQFPLPPTLCQPCQFLAEYRPVPEVIPAWGYLIEYVYGHSLSFTILIIPYHNHTLSNFYPKPKFAKLEMAIS